jgi:polar amino acid transport system substrate-binding protein
LPEWTKNWVGIAFRPSDSDFVKAFNVAQKAHLGTDEMLADVKEYGYTVSQLPAPAISTEYVCGIR